MAPAETEAFPFLKLPAEIRNMIYEYLMISGDQQAIWIRTRSTSTSYHNKAILSVNKQLNVEASPILYSKNTLHFDLSEENNILRYDSNIASTRLLRFGRSVTSKTTFTGKIYPHVMERFHSIKIVVWLDTCRLDLSCIGLNRGNLGMIIRALRRHASNQVTTKSKTLTVDYRSSCEEHSIQYPNWLSLNKVLERNAKGKGIRGMFQKLKGLREVEVTSHAGSPSEKVLTKYIIETKE